MKIYAAILKAKVLAFTEKSNNFSCKSTVLMRSQKSHDYNSDIITQQIN